MVGQALSPANQFLQGFQGSGRPQYETVIVKRCIQFALLSLALSAAAPAQQAPRIVIDYPEEGSIFPPDFAPPTFLWRDSDAAATAWQLEIAFPDGAPAIHLNSRGEPMTIGEIDPRCVAESNQLPKLTPEQAAAHTWKPDAATWSEITRRSAGHPATVTIAGSGGARAQVRITTSDRPGGRAHLLSRRPAHASRSGEGRDQAHHSERRAPGRLAPAQRRRKQQPAGDGGTPHLRQLPLLLQGRQDPRPRRGRSAE